jgi:hypothetical protein
MVLKYILSKIKDGKPQKIINMNLNVIPNYFKVINNNKIKNNSLVVKNLMFKKIPVMLLLNIDEKYSLYLMVK